METTRAGERQDSIQNQFECLVASLRMEESSAANWLEDAQKGLADIFGANPGRVWENLVFLYYLWVLIDTTRQMRDRQTLPQISRDAYEQASREWGDNHAKSSVEREILHALNTFRHELFSNFETLLRGSPIENGGAEAYCRGAFTKLLRMIRLTRQIR